MHVEVFFQGINFSCFKTKLFKELDFCEQKLKSGSLI